MSYLKRAIQDRFIKRLQPGKVIVLLGPRRVGKTVFIQQILEKINEPYLLLNGEDLTTVDLLKDRTVANYKRLVGRKKLLIIDEAQKIPDIGTKLKLMVDEIKGIKIIASGSSSFDLGKRVGEPLLGRQYVFKLLPVSQMEYMQEEDAVKTKDNLEERLVFGSYPELRTFTSPFDKKEYLDGIISSYLLKDLLMLDGIRRSNKLFDLLRLVAFQVGSEVSYTELGEKLGMSKNTVEHYLDLLSEVYIVYKLQPYNRNMRNTITRKSKWYFYDNGIRNALVLNLNPIKLRNDIGALWENYLFSERIKYQHYTGMLCHNYFWRTYDGQEIDWIEDRGGKLHCCEMKWNPKKGASMPNAWQKENYNSDFQVINSKNYLDWIGA